MRKALGLVVSGSLAILFVCLTTSLTTPGGCDVIHTNLSAKLCADTVVGVGPVRLMLGLSGAAGLFIALSVVWRAERHRRLAGLLERVAEPAVLGGVSVGIVDGIGPASVAGLRIPRIYCASDLATVLDPEELRAVLLHERHHQIEHTPSRLILLDGVGWPLRRSAVGRRWIARTRAQLEIAADRYALAAGATRADLASALLKLGDENAPFSVAGYSASSELRLRALLDDAPYMQPSHSPWIAPAVALAAVLLLCLVV